MARDRQQTFFAPCGEVAAVEETYKQSDEEQAPVLFSLPSGETGVGRVRIAGYMGVPENHGNDNDFYTFPIAGSGWEPASEEDTVGSASRSSTLYAAVGGYQEDALGVINTLVNNDEDFPVPVVVTGKVREYSDGEDTSFRPESITIVDEGVVTEHQLLAASQYAERVDTYDALDTSAGYYADTISFLMESPSGLPDPSISAEDAASDGEESESSGESDGDRPTSEATAVAEPDIDADPDDPVTAITGIGPKRAGALSNLGIETVADLVNSDAGTVAAEIDGISADQVAEWTEA